MKKFLLLFALIISGMGLFAQTKADVIVKQKATSLAETSTNTNEYLELEILEVTSTTALVSGSIISYDAMGWGVFVLTQDVYDNTTDSELLENIKNDIDTYGVVSYDESFEFGELTPGTKYVFVGYVLAYDCTILSIEDIPFTTLNSDGSTPEDPTPEDPTPDDPTPDIPTPGPTLAEISVEIYNITGTDVSYIVTPNSNTKYYKDALYLKDDFEAKDDNTIMSEVLKANSYSGVANYYYDELTPSTEYVLVFVAFDESDQYSKIGNIPFTTKFDLSKETWWNVDYSGYSLGYARVSDDECAVRGNMKPSVPTNIDIPSVVSKDGKDYKVVQIYDSAFESWKDAISFNLPNSIENIGHYAFSECTSMANLPIPESVVTIGASAFEKCSRLVAVNMPSTVREIFEQAFFECRDLGTVTFAENSAIGFIGREVFLDCTSLFKITIPGSVNYLGESVFGNCTGLKDVTFGDNSMIVNLEDNTFENCEKLKNVTFGENSSLESINKNLFSDCPNLESIVFGDNAKLGIIEENAFKDHTKLSKVAFGKNSVLHTIYDYSFQGCTSLTSIEIPSSVNLLGRSAFEGCSALPSFVVPEGVKSLGNSNFKDCTSLKIFEISSTVTTIPNSVFSGCTSLSTLTCKATSVPTTGDEVFEGVPNSMVIRVYRESLPQYQSESPWNEYILKAIEDSDEPELPGDEPEEPGDEPEEPGDEPEEPGDEPEEPGDEPEEPGDEPEEPGDEPEEPGEGVEENAMTFTLYPNPVESNLTIATNEVITEVNIYSITGVMVYSTTNVNNNVINVSDLNAGIYFISIKSENGETTKRFIKK